jgi:hypothetical protein
MELIHFSPIFLHMTVMFMNEVSLEGDVLDFTIYIKDFIPTIMGSHRFLS